jgi:hypothetical protein
MPTEIDLHGLYVKDVRDKSIVGEACDGRQGDLPYRLFAKIVLYLGNCCLHRQGHPFS